MNEDIKGLRERIAIAGSPEEINRLLEEGSTYTDASDRTRAAWNHTAQRRRVELAKPIIARDVTAALKIATIKAREVLTSPLKIKTEQAQRRHDRRAQ